MSIRDSGRRMARLAIGMILAAWMAASCSDDDGDPSPDSGSVDAALADAALADASIDASPDAGPPLTCMERLVIDVAFEVDPSGPDTQIHGAAVFDGEAVWVAYNRPDGVTGGFDVWAARLECDGTHRLAPFQANTTPGGNDIDPALAMSDGNVYMVWTSDNGTGINNMDIFYRTFTLDGTAVMAEDRILETTYNGQDVPYNAMCPAVTSAGVGHFVVGGCRGLPEMNNFQIFAQRIEPDGTLIGEALNGRVDGDISQVYPSLAMLEDGSFYLAWTESDANTEDHVVHTFFSTDATEPSPVPPAEASLAATSSCSACAASAGGQGYVILAFNAGGSIFLKDGSVFDPGATAVELGASNRIDHSPQLALSPGGGAVAYYRNISGIRNDVVLAPFTFGGGSFTMGPEVVLPDGPAPSVYGLAFTHIGEDVFFVAWSEGTSPDFRLLGKFVRLPMS